MSVVLRCPSCGTTRAMPGECEACHEAEVRYFCTNHTPGLWLASPGCLECGAIFGEAKRSPSSMPVARPSLPAARSTAPSIRPSAAPAIERRAPPPPARRHAPSGPPRVARAWRPAPELADPEPSAPGLAPWQRLLGEVLRARAMTRSTASYRAPLARGSTGGCLRRVLWMVLFVFFALVAAVVYFGRALMHQL